MEEDSLEFPPNFTSSEVCNLKYMENLEETWKILEKLKKN